MNDRKSGQGLSYLNIYSRTKRLVHTNVLLFAKNPDQYVYTGKGSRHYRYYVCLSM